MLPVTDYDVQMVPRMYPFGLEPLYVPGADGSLNELS